MFAKLLGHFALLYRRTTFCNLSLSFNLAALKDGGSCSSPKSTVRNSSVVKELLGVSPNSMSLKIYVNCEYVSTIPITFNLKISLFSKHLTDFIVHSIKKNILLANFYNMIIKYISVNHGNIKLTI